MLIFRAYRVNQQWHILIFELLTELRVILPLCASLEVKATILRVLQLFLVLNQLCLTRINQNDFEPFSRQLVGKRASQRRTGPIDNYGWALSKVLSQVDGFLKRLNKPTLAPFEDRASKSEAANGEEESGRNAGDHL